MHLQEENERLEIGKPRGKDEGKRNERKKRGKKKQERIWT